MEWKKAKNILLLVLIFANILLGVNLFMLLNAKQNEDDAKIELAVQNINSRGHSCNSEDIKALPKILNVYTVKRDKVREEEIAQKLLGECKKSEIGGGIEEYSNEIGKFVFRSGGSFFGEIYGGNIQGNMLEQAKNILNIMGIKTWKTNEKDEKVYGFFLVDNKYHLENFEIIIEQTTRGVQISGKIFYPQQTEDRKFSVDYAKSIIEIANNFEMENKKLKPNKVEIVYVLENNINEENSYFPILKITTAKEEIFFNAETMKIIKK